MHCFDKYTHACFTFHNFIPIYLIRVNLTKFVMLLSQLEAPATRVCGLDTPFPLVYEPFYMPTKNKVSTPFLFSSFPFNCASSHSDSIFLSIVQVRILTVYL